VGQAADVVPGLRTRHSAWGPAGRRSSLAANPAVLFTVCWLFCRARRCMGPRLHYVWYINETPATMLPRLGRMVRQHLTMHMTHIEYAAGPTQSSPRRVFSWSWLRLLSMCGRRTAFCPALRSRFSTPCRCHPPLRFMIMILSSFQAQCELCTAPLQEFRTAADHSRYPVGLQGSQEQRATVQCLCLQAWQCAYLLSGSD
jgi:hypothetical protein